MALKREEFQALIEREGLSDFIWARNWKDIENSNIGLFEMANDRWGCCFQISPSVYAGKEAEQRLSNLFNSIDMPNFSSIQFFTFASRNLTPFMESFYDLHSSPAIIENKEALLELRDSRVNWIKKHANENIFQQGNDLRLRNFINLICITIPKDNEKNGLPFSESELVTHFSRVEQGVSEFFPKKFSSQQWVNLMREILIPDNPLWFAPNDNKNALNYQVVNNDSILVLNEDSKGICTRVSKKYYYKLMKDQNLLVDEEEEEDESPSFFKRLFGKKKKEEMTDYAKWQVKTFTTKMFPPTITMSEVANKFYDYLGERMSPMVPCPFMVSLTIYFENREDLKKDVADKAKWNLWQTNALGESSRFFPEIIERAREAETVNGMIYNGFVPMTASWSCSLMDTSITNVRKYSENLKNEFMRSNWILQEEKLIPHWIFLYSLPMNFEPFVLKDLAKRMNTLFSANCAAITPLVTGDKGYGKPILTYVDRGGQISGVDIFDSTTNYNFVVVGSSGSGKSYIMADFFNNYLLHGAKIRVIDVGRSYKSYCDIIGGQYIEFTKEADMCLNFFTNIQAKDDGTIEEDEIQTIVPLIGLMAMQEVDSDSADDIKIPVIKSYISKAVVRAFEDKQRNAGMQDIGEALEQINLEIKSETGEIDRTLQDLIISLDPFSSPKGEYYRYFNGTNNLKFISDFAVLELEELDSKKHLKSVVLAAIAHNINTEFFLGKRDQPKILAVDEAWSIMDNKIVANFLETMARRIRKYNGASGIITQSLGDFFKNKSTEAIFANSAWKFFLQQNKESLHSAKNSNNIAVDPSLLFLLETVKQKAPYYSEVLIKQDNMFFIGRLMTDKLSHWLYTNHPGDMKVVRDIEEAFSIKAIDARMIKGYSVMNGTSIEEEYINRVNSNKLSLL